MKAFELRSSKELLSSKYFRLKNFTRLSAGHKTSPTSAVKSSLNELVCWLKSDSGDGRGEERRGAGEEGSTMEGELYQLKAAVIITHVQRLKLHCRLFRYKVDDLRLGANHFWYYKRGQDRASRLAR